MKWRLFDINWFPNEIRKSDKDKKEIEDVAVYVHQESEECAHGKGRRDDAKEDAEGVVVHGDAEGTLQLIPDGAVDSVEGAAVKRDGVGGSSNMKGDIPAMNSADRLGMALIESPLHRYKYAVILEEVEGERYLLHEWNDKQVVTTLTADDLATMVPPDRIRCITHHLTKAQVHVLRMAMRL